MEAVLGSDFYFVHFNRQPGVADAVFEENTVQFLRNLYPRRPKDCPNSYRMWTWSSTEGIPFSTLIHAMQGADEVFLPREYVQRRFDAISRSPALMERELVKLASLADTLVQVLEERGSEPQQARLATDLAMSVFRIASQNRQTTQKPFKELIHEAVQAQRRAGLSG